MSTRRELLEFQAHWLEDARARILRKAEIARRGRVLDLGCGYGAVTRDLERRSRGLVVALDIDCMILPRSANSVCADARNLPFLDRSFDLVFSQNVLLWIGNTTNIVNEADRILKMDGVWVLFEPDYGGMMEYPPEITTRNLWLSALPRAGADPLIGRKLPVILRSHGWQAETELLPRLVPPDPARFDFLDDLPLSEPERKILNDARRAAAQIDSDRQTCLLPYYMILARRE